MFARMIRALLRQAVFLLIIPILAMIVIYAHPVMSAAAEYAQVPELHAMIVMFAPMILAFRHPDALLQIIPILAMTVNLALPPMFAAEELVRARLIVPLRPIPNVMQYRVFATFHLIVLIILSRTILLAMMENFAQRRIYAKAACVFPEVRRAAALFRVADRPTIPLRLMMKQSRALFATYS